MFAFDMNLTTMAVQRTVVEHARKTAPWAQDFDQGQRYEAYHRQTGNRYATLYVTVLRLWHALGHAQHPASQRPVSRRPNVELAHGGTVAR